MVHTEITFPGFHDMDLSTNIWDYFQCVWKRKPHWYWVDLFQNVVSIRCKNTSPHAHTELDSKCAPDIQCPHNESSLCLHKMGVYSRVLWVYRGEYLTDPCYLYVFQIALKHKPFFANNSLESKPCMFWIRSPALQLGVTMTAFVWLCGTVQRETRMANKSYFQK